MVRKANIVGASSQPLDDSRDTTMTSGPSRSANRAASASPSTLAVKY